ncbi:hypothetical protein UlMin_013043 [Ulmus minor]
MAVSDPVPIPVDLFVSKKHPGLDHGDLCFVNSDGNMVYKATRPSSLKSSSSSNRILLDAAGNPLILMCYNHNGCWQCFKGDGVNKEMIARVQRTKNTLTRTELEVFVLGENGEEATPDFKVKGFPFQRSCTIYKGNQIVAQTSLMYKLNQLFVKRGKFRLTIFPGSVDHTLVVALVVIFLH